MAGTPTDRKDIVISRPYEQIGVAIGRKMSGKSYAVKTLLEPVQRLIVWDYNWEHTDKIIVHNLQGLDFAWKTAHRKRIAFQPLSRTPEAFEQFLTQVYTYRYVCLLIEEIRVYTMKNKTPKVLFDIIDTGRFIPKIGLWCTSRRSFGITVDIMYNADHILAFKQYKPEDLKYLGEYMDSDLVEQLKTQPPYYFVYFNGETGESYIHEPL